MDYLDDMALACAALGMTEEQGDQAMNDGTDLDELIFDKFEVSMEQFSKIAESLLCLTPQVKSPLTGGISHAFGYSGESGVFTAIVKKEVA